MARASNKIDIYLEIGQKRTFAGALHWPGWCRSGRDEDAAVQALLESGPRYARVVRPSRLGFQAPRDASRFVIRERLAGNATTDFGAPGIAPSTDAAPVDSTELQRFEKLLRACWQSLERAVEMASGKVLRTGPRGGGRKLDDILSHLLEADLGYLSQTGGKLKRDRTAPFTEQVEQTRRAILSALAASARGEIAPKGPRGGMRWSPRYFVRRVAWHTLDHVWEIEDRAILE